MDLVLIVALAALAVAAYILGRRQGAATAHPGEQALLADLRTQLDRAAAEGRQEAAAKVSALQAAAAADAAREAAQRQLSDARTAHEAELQRLRQQAADDRRTETDRHQRDLEQLKASFAQLSQEVLKGMAPDVTKEVATKVQPLVAEINTALKTYRESLQQGLKTQDDTLAQMRTQMQALTQTTTELATSTTDFTAVLKSSQHRGRWGEQTLRRVVEVAGLSVHCDFTEQVTQGDARPDLIVHLPGRQCVIVDSKVPEFDVALAQPSAPNRRELVTAHAEKLRKTIRDLAARDYPTVVRQGGRQPFDSVILFLPAESLLSTALEGDSELILQAAEARILIATPATLIGFLGAIRLAWNQHQQTENAEQIAREATELYDRVATFAEHIGKVRKGLQAAADGLNSALGSYDRRVRPQGERLRGLQGIGQGKALAEVEPVTTAFPTLSETSERQG